VIEFVPSLLRLASSVLSPSLWLGLAFHAQLGCHNTTVSVCAESQLLCADVQVRLRDPVIASDGQTYERSAIEGWFQTLGGGPPRSPVTGQLMPSAALLPNLAVRDLVQRSQQPVARSVTLCCTRSLDS
jgi:hypothetical protein